MPTYFWIPIILIVLAISGFVLYYIFFSRKKRIIRDLKKDGLANIQQVKEGQYVCLMGEVELPEAKLQAPISGNDCVLYYVKAWVHKNDGEAIVAQETEATSFTIKTTGKRLQIAIDDPKSLDFSLEKSLTTNKREARNFLNGISAFLDKHKVALTNPITKKERNFYLNESRLDPGDKVIVKGIAKHVKDKNGEALLQLSGGNKKKLLITNEPEAFKILNA